MDELNSQYQLFIEESEVLNFSTLTVSDIQKELSIRAKLVTEDGYLDEN
ncbi:hypothetical protein V1503_24625 [Bacillus sp. SCS-151]